MCESIPAASIPIKCPGFARGDARGWNWLAHKLKTPNDLHYTALKDIANIQTDTLLRRTAGDGPLSNHLTDGAAGYDGQ